MKRAADALTDEPFDLLILGGGITGAGVALDAALRGLRVALIDKGDFASGTSSVSSKLAHGGLRYLEHRDFHLVYEALHERQRLLRNAPHLVHPLRFVIPFHQGSRLPPWQWRLGLTLYDLLAGRGNIQRSRPLDRRRLQHEFPGLQRAGLVGGAAYFDAQMDDARLCLAVIRSAAEAGAVPCNHVEARAFDTRGGAITGVHALDRLTGHEHTIRARQVLNATGPWVDQVCKLAGDERGPRLRPTKGVHIVTLNPGLRSAFLCLHPADGRVFFVIPWMRGASPSTDKLLIGTTDTICDDSPDHLAVTPADVAYLLEGYNRYLGPALTAGDVLGSFVGLRPLIRSGPGEPSALTREFRVFASPAGLLSVAGGKYTTYRQMAEVIADTICQRLGRRRLCRTREFPLDGAPQEPWSEFAPAEQARLRSQHGLSEGSARHLVDRYGQRAGAVASYLKSHPQGAEPFVPGEPDLCVEFAYQREHEMAMLPSDFLLRRTRLGLFHPKLLKSPPTDLVHKTQLLFGK